MNKPGRIRLVALVLLTLAVALAAWWLQAGRSSARQAPATDAPAGSAAAAGPTGARPPGAGAMAAPPAVEVAAVQQRTWRDEASAVGTLVSRQRVVVRPEVAGRIVAIGFQDGAAVRRGQLLFQLDDALPRAELAQAQAQRAVAEANYRRNQELVARGFVTQRVLDESQAALQVAEAQVALVQARLERLRILAPFDGVAGIRLVHVGEVVREGTDLVHLEDTAQLFVDFRLPERYLPQLRLGQPVQLQLDAAPEQRATARVVAIDPLVDAEGRALLLRARIDSPAGNALRPGMFARVSLVIGEQPNALLVPEAALVPLGAQTVVYRIERAAHPGDPAQARRVVVRTGGRQAGWVQVLEGLQPGDSVVVAGQQRLQRELMPVRIVEPAAAAAGAKS